MSPMFTDQFGPVACHDDVRYALWNHLDGERKGDYDQRDGAELRILATDAALRAALAEAQAENKALKFENRNLALTVKALTPAANYCLEYKPLLLAAEAERDRLRERVAELEEDLIDIPDVAK